jgi:hypothetical protein
LIYCYLRNERKITMKTVNLFMALVLITGLALVAGPVPVAQAATTLTVDASTGTIDFGDACPTPSDSAVYKSLQAAIDCAVSGDTIEVKDGTYGVTGLTGCKGYNAAILIKDLDDLTIQAAPGHEPKIKPVTAVEADIVSISIQNSDRLIIDNIDSDQTTAQWDNWHVCDSEDLTVRNSTFEGGEDGIDFETSHTTALIENNTFKDINTGNGDEALDFTDGSFSDIVIQDNVFLNNYRQITISDEHGTPNGFTIRRNFMDGTTSQEAVRFIGANDITLENNVIMNSTQQGLYIDSGSTNINVWHNSFFNNGEEEIRTKMSGEDIVIKNNIIYANGTSAAISANTDSLPGEDFNLIFNNGTDTESSQAAITTFGANTLFGDPLFVSATAGSEDLHLTSGSPAIAAGMDLGVTDDIEQSSRPNPAGTPPDMGAYEFEQEPTAISLVSFGAEADAGSVTLTWETGAEISNAGFNLYRAASPDGPWTQINEALIAARGDPVAGASYTFTDTPGYGTFYYQLEDVDYFGLSTQHGPTSVKLGSALRLPWFRPLLPEF